MKKLIPVFCLLLLICGCNNDSGTQIVSTASVSLTDEYIQESWYPVFYSETFADRIEVEEVNDANKIGIRANAICTSGLYNFDSPNELTPAATAIYFSTVFTDYPFSKDIIEQGSISRNGYWLNYNQMLMIMENEFGLKKLSFKVSDTEKFFLRVDPSDNDVCELISMKQTGDLISVVLQPPQRYLGQWAIVNEFAVDEYGGIKKEFTDPKISTDAVKIQVEYIFKIRPEGIPMLQSGKRIV